MSWPGTTSPIPNSIKEGQVLRIAPPGAAPAAAGEAVVAQPVVTTPVVESRPLDAPGKSRAGPPAPSAGDGVKREPRGGKEPYSDEAYARLNRPGEAAAKPPVVAVDPKPEPKPEYSRGKARTQAGTRRNRLLRVLTTWRGSGRRRAR